MGYSLSCLAWYSIYRMSVLLILNHAENIQKDFYVPIYLLIDFVFTYLSVIFINFNSLETKFYLYNYYWNFLLAFMYWHYPLYHRTFLQTKYLVQSINTTELSFILTYNRLATPRIICAGIFRILSKTTFRYMIHWFHRIAFGIVLFSSIKISESLLNCRSSF